MFDLVMYRPPKNWNFQSEAKEEQVIAIVTTCSVSCLFFVLILFSESFFCGTSVLMESMKIEML